MEAPNKIFLPGDHDSTTIAIDEFDPEFYAKVAVEWADTLIAKLKKK